MSYQIIAEVPVEPADRAVVLDTDGHAWQRIGETWAGVGGHLFGGKHWRHLVVDRGPLTLLTASDGEPGRLAGYLDEVLESLNRVLTRRREHDLTTVEITAFDHHSACTQLINVARLLRGDAPAPAEQLCPRCEDPQTAIHVGATLDHMVCAEHRGRTAPGRVTTSRTDAGGPS